MPGARVPHPVRGGRRGSAGTESWEEVIATTQRRGRGGHRGRRGDDDRPALGTASRGGCRVVASRGRSRKSFIALRRTPAKSGVPTTDPITFVVATLSLIGVAIVASLIPARRAMRA